MRRKMEMNRLLFGSEPANTVTLLSLLVKSPKYNCNCKLNLNQGQHAKTLYLEQVNNLVHLGENLEQAFLFTGTCSPAAQLHIITVYSWLLLQIY